MDKAFRFIKAGKEHIPELVRLRIAFLEDYWGEQSEAIRKSLELPLKAYFTKAIMEVSYISFLAVQNSEPLGIGGMVLREQPGGFKNPTGKVAYVMNMYTLPPFRKKGIGGRILKLLVEEADRLGYKLLELHATREGEPLYISEGFVLHPEPTYRKFL